MFYIHTIKLQNVNKEMIKISSIVPTMPIKHVKSRLCQPMRQAQYYKQYKQNTLFAYYLHY